jgi:hypothetical protein
MSTGNMVPHARSVIHDVRTPKVADVWDDNNSNLDNNTTETTDNRISQNNWFKRVFFLSLIFAFSGAIFLGVSFFLGPKNISEKNVITTIGAPGSIPGGESFNVTVTVTNKNKVPLEYVKVVLEYPQVPGGSIDGLSQEKTVDSIPSGEIRDIPFSVTLYGAEQSVRNIKARVSYRIPGSVALFESYNDRQLTLTSSPVRLALNIPETVFPNQEVTLVVDYTSNLPSISPASMFKIDYPEQFTVITANPKPDIQNNIWKVGTLIPGEKHTITIRGRMSGVLNSTIPFTGTIGSFSSIDTNSFESIYTTYIAQTNIRQAFMAADIDISGATRYAEQLIISPMADNDITVRLKNTQTTSLNNVKVKVNLSGNLFKGDILSSGSGFFDEDTNTITWTQDESSILRSIAPNTEAELQFNIHDISSLDNNNTPIQQPKLAITVDIDGVTPEGKVISLQNIASENITLATEPSLITKLISGSTPIVNTGVYPPRIGQESSYTVYWKLANTTNDVADATVTATLPQWMYYTSSISPQSATGFINYNPVNRTVTWKPGTLVRGSGYNLRSPDVYFQVRIKPGASQINTSPVLINTPTFTGVDTITQSKIMLTGTALTTSDTFEESSIGPVKR